VTIYEPHETAQWSTRELDRLIGKYVFVDVSGRQADGLVVDVGVGRGAVRYVQFTGGSHIDWNGWGDQVRVSVHTEAPEVNPL
jgi:hypothetical protein